MIQAGVPADFYTEPNEAARTAHAPLVERGTNWIVSRFRLIIGGGGRPSTFTFQGLLLAGSPAPHRCSVVRRPVGGGVEILGISDPSHAHGAFRVLVRKSPSGRDVSVSRLNNLSVLSCAFCGSCGPFCFASSQVAHP